MVRISEILCPVDLSEGSSHALDHALAMARSHGAHVTVMEVSWAGLPPLAYPASASLGTAPMLLPRQLEELRTELRLFTERSAATGVTMDVVLREGAVAPMILEEARSLGADLIVMGTHGRSGFDHLLLGSVTEKVLRKAKCAVMTVPPADTTRRPGRSARTIVCAMDYSPASQKGLEYALSLAQETKATLVLVHVFDWPADRPMPAGLEVETALHRRKVQDTARQELRMAVPDSARASCQTEEVTAIGRPHEEIVRIARERDADVIVMGVHGRSSMSMALFGSTTNQVVRHATCPVLTVRC